MKRDSPCEPAVGDTNPDKRPKLDQLDTTGRNNTTLEFEAQADCSAITSAVANTTPTEPGAIEADEPTPSLSKRKNKTRGSRGRGRDQRARTDRNAERKGSWASRGTRNEDDKPVDDIGEKAPRLPKKKVAVLIGFCGTGYNGMQIQREAGTNTIENTLFDAMVKAGAVSKDNSDDPVKVNFQRAARTDAGVHAAGNVVSLKMITEPPDTPDLVAKLNELLPPEIRVWTFVRATNAFNSSPVDRTACDSRVYEYMFPSSALLPPMPGTPMERHTKPETIDPNGPDWEYWSLPDATKPETMRAWRIGKGQFEALRESAKLYEGTHNFHNFTVGLEHSDPSALRYMISIDVKEPYVLDGIEWISVMYHGQSFMLHQRKMTTLLIFTSRTGTPASSLIPQAFNSPKLLIPKAPALGLLLQEPRFGTYNKHVLEENELAAGRGETDRVREPIEWEPLREKIDGFKHAYIYRRIRAEEAKQGVFAAWLKFIDSYDGWEFKYLNPRGEIPSEAVVHPEKRKQGSTNKFREYLWKNPAGKGGESVPDSEDEEGDTIKKPSVDMEG
ncbi:tRNA pseudouridine synthase A [Rhizoctonia solani]|uniref:tRNA pseudouridine synthase A n=1 Tax=Rhizoctonia solani TaxID=456999 RepID=A0A0K6G7R0_9AGAM|nr:tRNA pseudouridine synthase A [Rhizoctonia solani]